KDFWEYDPVGDMWSQKADFGGNKRSGAIGFSIANKGYIGTGYSSPVYYKDFWEYDPSTNTWTQKADFGASARSDAVSFIIGNKGYVGTGRSGTFPNQVYYKDLWEYNPANNIWTQKMDFTGGTRYGAVGFGIDNKGYLGTGSDGVYKKDFWEYTPEECIGLTLYADEDNDAFGDAANIFFAADCIVPVGYVNDSTDCNDSNVLINPGATEVCDNFDNNCDGNIDEGLLLTFYADADGDGFGDAGNAVLACALSAGFVTDTTDCDDTNATIFPGAPEISTNGIDDNCDGYIDEFGTGIEEVKSISLFNIFPNPANNQTTLQFTLPHTSQVNVAVFDLSGKKINSLIDDEMQQGNHSLQLYTTQFSKGVYLLRMKSADGIHNEKLIIQ
ncbi:MAG: MopE-related protein, partial [Chitinophagales bacterium]